jgi:hypothetical protein
MALVPGDRSLSARSVAASFGALAWFAVSLRLYVRLKLVKCFGWDDGLMVLALVCISSLDHLPDLADSNLQVFYTVFCACMITASHYGTGKHEANLTHEAIVIALRVRHLSAFANSVSHF